jgi:hypothetical protein
MLLLFVPLPDEEGAGPQPWTVITCVIAALIGFTVSEMSPPPTHDQVHAALIAYGAAQPPDWCMPGAAACGLVK